MYPAFASGVMSRAVKKLTLEMPSAARSSAGRLGQMDEQVEVVAHEAIRQNLDAGKRRHEPQPLDEARTLLVSQVERAVRAPSDQVITTISLEIAQSSHAAYSSIFRNYSTTPTPPLVSDPHPLQGIRSRDEQSGRSHPSGWQARPRRSGVGMA